MGLTTAVFAYLAGSVQADIKSALSYASLTQVGIITVEIGLGFRYVALIHLLGHACLRALQFLRAPTLLHDYHTLENAIGDHLPTAGVPWVRLQGPARRELALSIGPPAGLSRRVPVGLPRRAVRPGLSMVRQARAPMDRLPLGRGVARVGPGQAALWNDRRILMNPLSLPWLEMSIVVTLLGSLLVSRLREPIRAYHWGLAFTGAAFVCTLLAWLGFYLRIPIEPSLALSPQYHFFGRQIFALDELNAPLVPTVCLIHFLTALATARVKMRRYSFTWSLAAESIRIAMFSATDPWLLIGLLAASTVPPYIELASRGRPTRVYVIHMALFVGLLVLGWSAVELRGRDALPTAWASIALLLAILVRCGTVPAHCWVTDWFEHATFGIALLFVCPLSGVYAAVRLVLPIAPDWVLHSISIASLITAVYAAGMAVVQNEVRRFYAHLFLSHASLVLVGLGAEHRHVADGLAVPVVLGHPVAGRLRPDAPGAGIPIRTALPHELPRPVRTRARAGGLLPPDGTGERGLSGYARLHLDRAAGRQRRRGQPDHRYRGGRRGGAQRDRRGAGLSPPVHRGAARLDGLAGDRDAGADRRADPGDDDAPRRPVPPARRHDPGARGRSRSSRIGGPASGTGGWKRESPPRLRLPRRSRPRPMRDLRRECWIGRSTRRRDCGHRDGFRGAGTPSGCERDRCCPSPQGFAVASNPRRSECPRQRCDVTPTCRHIESKGQVEHLGRMPVQMDLPNGTSRSLISTQ